MFTTTFAAAALTGLLPVGAETLTPTWQSDYQSAIQVAVAQQKPVAVFIGHGEAGYDKLVSDGKIPADAGKQLANGYVCLYVDTDTAAGKTLAGQFQLTEGLVISSPGGAVQALRHSGNLSSAQLTGYVAKYSQPATVVTTDYRGTVVNSGVVQASGVAPVGVQPVYSGQVIYGGCANGQCPTYTPVYSGYNISGGCANGQCPRR